MTIGSSRGPTLPLRPLRVFVGSTYADLRDERRALERALALMRGVVFVGMENFGSRPDRPIEVCLREVEESDVYVGIFGHRYGSIDPESCLSITELEYRQARRSGLACLVYLKDDAASVPPGLGETDLGLAARLRGLKEELKRDLTVDFFMGPDELATRVTTALHNLMAELPLKRPAPSNSCTDLHAALVRHFDTEELKTLCFVLGVDYDNLGGSGKEGKARDLITYMERRGKVDALAAEFRRLRPGIEWR
jgi:Domain of unknown function (DUF4062)/Effector-associated domain 7